LAQSTTPLAVIVLRQQSLFFVIHFHQENHPYLNQQTQLEVILNFYTLLPMLYASQININLMVSISSTVYSHFFWNESALRCAVFLSFGFLIFVKKYWQKNQLVKC